MSFVRRLAALGLALAAVLPLSAQTATVPALAQTMPNQSLAIATGSLTLDLRGLFYVPGVTGTITQFTTDLGKFNVELYGSDAPLSVANFLSYVNDGSYNGTIIHRSTPLNQVNGVYTNGIIQGGGYLYAIPPTTVPKKNPIVLEYKLPNIRGTIAMARTSDLNSATSEWFINQDNNSDILGASNNGGYAVFGRVLGTGMTVVDAIYAVKTFNANSSSNPNGPFNNLPLQNYDNTKPVALANLVNVSKIAVIPIYPTAGGGTSLLNFSATSNATSVVTVALSGSNLTLTPVTPGAATVTVSASDVNGNLIVGSFLASVQSFAAPTITAQPLGHTIAAGTTTVFNVTATGTALTYQWKKDGNVLTGATSPRLVLTTAQAGDAGSYTVTVGGPNNTSVTSDPAVLSVVTSTNPGRISNLSIRAGSGTGNRVLIMGFVAGAGTGGSTPMLIRGVGPTILSQLPDALPDPVIQIIPQGGAVLASNDNWGGDAALKAAATATGAFPLISDTSKDAALLSSLPGGVYSVIVSDKTGAAGSVLAEIYDATVPAVYDATKPRLVNISARAYVNAANVLIAGFVVTGDTAKTMLIRGIGPNPAFASAVGSDALADPVVTLNKSTDSGSVTLLTADNWGGDTQITSVGDRVGASALTNSASKDAAVLVTLDPGVYSAVAYGANSSAGIMLMEVYEVP
ncbi:MAG: peptidylprolyl isomerase [Verrucomicrobia bacterium]|nr:peptidylprolyl isomerase [Verrucomicrobiota bacterium]